MKPHDKSKPNAHPPASPSGVRKTKPHPRGVFRFKTFDEFNAFKAAHHLTVNPPTACESEDEP